MIVHESVGVGEIDYFGQATTPATTAPITVAPATTTPAPAPVPSGPVGTQTIPIVTLGPATILDRAGYAITGIRATVRTPARILTVSEVPGGIFQMTVDRADFDAGISILIGAPGYNSISIPAAGIVCNTGTRNEYGAVTSMTANQCPFRSYYLPQVAAPAAASAPAPAPAPRKRSRTAKYWETAQKYGAALMPGAGSAKAGETQTPANAMQFQQGQQQGQGMSPLTMAAIGGGIVVVGLAAIFMFRK